MVLFVSLKNKSLTTEKYRTQKVDVKQTSIQNNRFQKHGCFENINNDVVSLMSINFILTYNEKF